MGISEYQNFTFVEWSRLIASVIFLFRIIYTMSSSSDMQNLAQFGKYLEILCSRMHELSNTKSGAAETPNVFCLWESVLKIVREKYAQLMEDMKERAVATLNLSSMCPVLNGSIRQSEYWENLTHDYQCSSSVDAISEPSISMAGNWIAWESLFYAEDIYGGLMPTFTS
jgi:hypothetical protein